MRRAFGYLRDRTPHPPPPNSKEPSRLTIHRRQILHILQNPESLSFRAIPLQGPKSQILQPIALTGNKTQQFRSCYAVGSPIP